MSFERVGVHTGGALNREKAREVLISVVATQVTSDAALDALEACVVPDPRIGEIEAELDRHERETRLTERGELHLRRLRAILMGSA